MNQLYKRFAFILIFALSFVIFGPLVAHAGVNDFSFSSFDADYYLSKDSEGRSTMKVIERLTAEFVNKDQNKGIERAITKYYDGHTLSFNLESLTRNGLPEPIYEQRNEPGFVVVATGTDDYVNGTQQYVFTYTLRDVVKTFGDHQELYWDTNGTGWSQRFDKLNARVHLDDSIKSDFTGKIWCYEGVSGSNTKCPSENDGSVIYFKSNGQLNAYENVTINLSFNSGTFAGYRMTIADIIPFIFSGFALLIFAAAIAMKIRFGRNNPGRGTIIPEYLPPKNTSVLMSAEIFNKAATSSTAMIIDLAVRKKLRIIESEGKFLFVKNTKYTVELLNVDGLNSEELEFVNILFEGKVIGSKYDFSRTDQSRSVKLVEFGRLFRKETEDIGYRQKQVSKKIIQICLIVAAGLMAIIGVVNTDGSNGTSVLICVSVFVLIITLSTLFKLYDMRPLTAPGRELFDYLKGLEMYIKLAEADRLKVLQSPQGADTKPINTNDGQSMVVLYERVLPYAVLFGQEKEWLKQLGIYYESNQVSPGWYSGIHAFNAANFASSVGSFSSYSNSSSFSSSSGAGGGGSSGGGGGGGGGGGR